MVRKQLAALPPLEGMEVSAGEHAGDEEQHGIAAGGAEILALSIFRLLVRKPSERRAGAQAESCVAAITPLPTLLMLLAPR